MKELEDDYVRFIALYLLIGKGMLKLQRMTKWDVFLRHGVDYAQHLTHVDLPSSVQIT